MATSSSMVTYPDRDPNGLACIEIRTAAWAHGYEVLEEEIEALSAASLLIQLELGMPVIKLLNTSDLLTAEGGAAARSRVVSGALNYLGLLTNDDARYRPEKLVGIAMEKASPRAAERFAGAPQLLERIFRFIDATGAAEGVNTLRLPWVHMSVDRRAVSREGALFTEMIAELPSLENQVLWWQRQGDGPGTDRLFRSAFRDIEHLQEDVPTELVPLPFARPDEATVVDDRPPMRSIRSVAGSTEVVGFSLPAEHAHVSTVEEYGRSLTAAVLDATADFIAARNG